MHVPPYKVYGPLACIQYGIESSHGQHVEPYPMASHLIRGFLDLAENTSNGSRRNAHSWAPTTREAVFLHECVHFNEWEHAADSIPKLHDGTYEHLRLGFELHAATNIYSNLGSRVGFTDPRGVTVKAELTDSGLETLFMPGGMTI